MWKLEDQISEYFTALHSGDDDDLAMPAYPVAEPHRPRRSRHRRTALVVAAVVVVAALATLGLVKSTEDSSPFVGTPDTDRPAPPPVPDGWKAIVFQTVQFAVPQDWPVYDEPRCWDPISSAAYLGGPSADSSCPSPDALGVGAIPYANNWDAHIAQLEATGGQRTAANGTVYTLRTLNGLRAVVIITKPADGTYWMYDIVLPDERILMELSPTRPDDDDLAQQIIETIGAAPDSTQPTKPPNPPVVEGPTDPVPSTEPAVIPDDIQPEPQANPAAAEFCAAVEDFRQSGLTDPDTGLVSPEAQPYFERMVETAPDDLRPAVETIRAWLQQGAPTPKPPEVGDAEMQSTLDWMNNCQGGAPG